MLSRICSLLTLTGWGNVYVWLWTAGMVTFLVIGCVSVLVIIGMGAYLLFSFLIGAVKGLKERFSTRAPSGPSAPGAASSLPGGSSPRDP